MRREGGGEREKARREGGRRVREREGKFHIFYMEQATLTGNSTKLYGTKEEFSTFLFLFFYIHLQILREEMKETINLSDITSTFNRQIFILFLV